jgi:hypothetical protein
MSNATQRPIAAGSGSSRNAEPKRPYQDLIDYCQEYTRQHPEVIALWCLGIGFVLGWRLKPW